MVNSGMKEVLKAFMFFILMSLPPAIVSAGDGQSENVFSLECNMTVNLVRGSLKYSEGDEEVRYWTIDIDSRRYCEFERDDTKAESCSSIKSVSEDKIVLSEFNRAEDVSVGLSIDRIDGSIFYIIKAVPDAVAFDGTCDVIDTVPIASRRF